LILINLARLFKSVMNHCFNSSSDNRRTTR